MGKVRKRVIYDGTSTGKGNHISMNDKYLYEVEYPDEMTEQLADNIIAENMMSQVDSEGNHYQVMGTYTGRGQLAAGKYQWNGSMDKLIGLH